MPRVFGGSARAAKHRLHHDLRRGHHLGAHGRIIDARQLHRRLQQRVGRRRRGRNWRRIVGRRRFHEHLAEVILRRRIARLEHNAGNDRVTAGHRQGAQVFGADRGIGVGIDDQAAVAARRVHAGDISAGLDLFDRIDSGLQSGELIIAVGIGDRGNLVAVRVGQRNAAAVAEDHRHVGDSEVVGGELAIADRGDIRHRLAILQDNRRPVLEDVAADGPGQGFGEVVIRAVDTLAQTDVPDLIHAVGLAAGRAHPIAVVEVAVRLNLFYAVGARRQVREAVVALRISRGGVDDVPRRILQIDGNARQTRFSGIDHAIVVEINEHGAAYAGRQQFAKVVVLPNHTACQGDAVDQVARIMGRAAGGAGRIEAVVIAGRLGLGHPIRTRR